MSKVQPADVVFWDEFSECIEKRDFIASTQLIESVFKQKNPKLNELKKIKAATLFRKSKDVATDIIKVLEQNKDEIVGSKKDFNHIDILMTGNGFDGWVAVTFISAHRTSKGLEEVPGLEDPLLYPLGFDPYEGEHSKEFFKYLKDNPEYDEFLKGAEDRETKAAELIQDEWQLEFNGQALSARYLYMAIVTELYLKLAIEVFEELQKNKKFLDFPKKLPFQISLSSGAGMPPPALITYDLFRDHKFSFLIGEMT